MTTFSFAPFFRSRKHSLAQHAPPWSPSLWLAALALCTLDHIFCSSLHNRDTQGTTPSYAAAVQHLLALFVQLCLMASNTVVIFYIIYMLATRRPRPEFFGASYICPVVTLLLLTVINIALAAVPLIIPAALVTITAGPGRGIELSESTSAHYQYAPSLLFLTYGVALSLVVLSISAGSILLWWGYEQRTPKTGAVVLPQDDELYDLTRPGDSLDLDK